MTTQTEKLGGKTSHRDPKEILKEIDCGEKKLESTLSEIQKLIWSIDSIDYD